MPHPPSTRFSPPTWEPPPNTPAVMPTGTPQVTIQVSVAPRFTNTIRQDGTAALLAGLVLGFAAALLMMDRQDPPG